MHPAEGETRHPQGYEDRLKFKPIISWSSVSSSRPSFRLKRNQLCDSAGQFLFVESQEQTMSLLAFCNSSIAESYLSLLAPTMNYTSGDVGNIPVLQGVLDAGEPGSISAKMIQLAKNDWDSAETSWSFVRHPLV